MSKTIRDYPGLLVPFDRAERRCLDRLAARKGLQVGQLVRRMIRCDLREMPLWPYLEEPQGGSQLEDCFSQN